MFSATFLKEILRQMNLSLPLAGSFCLFFYLYQYSSDLDEYELYIYIRYEYYFNIHVPYTSILTQPLAK